MIRMKRDPLVLVLTSLTMLGAAPILHDEQRARCRDILVRALEDDSPWIRVHAAEALIALKQPEPALAAFRPKAETTEPKYRIVVWRVLAQAEPDAAERRRFLERIRAALLDPQAPDHAHAMEALAKLHEPAGDEAERKRILEVADEKGPIAPFAVWRLANANDATAIDRLVALLSADDAITRARAGYVLSRLAPLPDNASHAINATLEKEPADSPARIMLRTAQGGDAVRELAHDMKAAPSGRYFAAMNLADNGTADDYAILEKLLNDPDSDVRVGAAYAMLHIDARGSVAAPSTQGR
jgi:SSS family solute:Na+ symporter